MQDCPLTVKHRELLQNVLHLISSSDGIWQLIWDQLPCSYLALTCLLSDWITSGQPELQAQTHP